MSTVVGFGRAECVEQNCGLMRFVKMQASEKIMRLESMKRHCVFRQVFGWTRQSLCSRFSHYDLAVFLSRKPSKCPTRSSGEFGNSANTKDFWRLRQIESAIFLIVYLGGLTTRIINCGVDGAAGYSFTESKA